MKLANLLLAALALCTFTGIGLAQSSSDAESPAPGAPVVAGATGAYTQGYHAKFVSWGGPFKPSYAPGELFDVKFTLRNDGTTPWRVNQLGGSGLVWAKQNGSPELRVFRWVVQARTVLPGQSHTWIATIQCPPNGGGFNLRFKLHCDNAAINDPTPIVRINVR